MSEVHRLSRADACRIAVLAQALGAQRPVDPVAAVGRVGVVQLDPTNAVAPSADLVLWSRLGSGYRPEALRDAVEEQALLEFRGTLRLPEDLAAHRAEMAAWPGPEPLKDWQVFRRDWVQINNSCRRAILDLLRTDGPLRAAELPDSCVQPWPSTGWNDHRNRRMMLDFLAQRGEIAVSGWSGRDRLWDLAERVYPDDPGLDEDEARGLRDVRRLATLGIARAPGPVQVLEALEGREVGEAAIVDGVRGRWRVDPAYLGRPLEGRVALLSPFDRLVADRKRMSDLFDFDYQLEMYKPARQRRWGYYALPVLAGDRLVGKVDAAAERERGVLTVHAIHEDEPFGADLADQVRAEIEDLARWLGLEPEISGAAQ